MGINGVSQFYRQRMAGVPGWENRRGRQLNPRGKSDPSPVWEDFIRPAFPVNLTKCFPSTPLYPGISQLKFTKMLQLGQTPKVELISTY